MSVDDWPTMFDLDAPAGTIFGYKDSPLTSTDDVWPAPQPYPHSSLSCHEMEWDLPDFPSSSSPPPPLSGTLTLQLFQPIMLESTLEPDGLGGADLLGPNAGLYRDVVRRYRAATQDWFHPATTTARKERVQRFESAVLRVMADLERIMHTQAWQLTHEEMHGLCRVLYQCRLDVDG